MKKIILMLAIVARSTSASASEIRILSTDAAKITSMSALNFEGSREYFNNCENVARSLDNILSYDKADQFFVFTSLCIGEKKQFEASTLILSGKIKTNLRNTSFTNAFCGDPNSQLVKLVRRSVRILSTETLAISIQEHNIDSSEICLDSKESVVLTATVTIK